MSNPVPERPSLFDIDVLHLKYSSGFLRVSFSSFFMVKVEVAKWRICSMTNKNHFAYGRLRGSAGWTRCHVRLLDQSSATAAVVDATVN